MVPALTRWLDWLTRHAALRALALLAAYALAVWAGRATRLPGSQLALVWPAAAVGFLWLASSWHDRRGLARDIVLLAAATWAVNVATGASPGLAMGFTVANLLLAVVSCVAVRALQPAGWRLRTPRDLLALVGGATAGALASAVAGPVAVWVAGGGDLRLLGAAWVVRNATSTFVFGAIVLRLVEEAREPDRRRARRTGEALAAAAVLSLGYATVFAQGQDLPIGYLLIPLSLVVALRLGATLAALHVLLAGCFVVAATLAGAGPFAVGPPVGRVLLAQSFVAVVGLVSLALALFRDERQVLLVAAESAREQALERELRFRAAFHDSPTAIAYSAPDGTVREVNAALRRALGLSTPRVVGRGLAELVHPDDRDRLVDRLAGRSAPDADVAVRPPLEVRVLRVDGVALWCELTVTLCHEAGGRSPYLLVQLLDVDARKATELSLERAARQDPLTGLGNRQALESELTGLLGEGAPGAALVLLDLDGFKPVNDMHGHEAGDVVLREVAARLRTAVRPDDTVVRLGGDEFVLVCPRRDDLDEAALAALVSRVEQAVEAPVVHDGKLLIVAASCGAVLAAPGESAQSALDRADRAMYAAKRARGEQARGPRAEGGRQRWVAADVLMAASLTAASREHRLDVHYQPVVDMTTGWPVGAEALVRIRDRDGTLLRADRAVAVAEANGLIARLGREVLERAVTQTAAWKAALPPGALFSIGVNVSPLQLHDTGLVAHVERVLADTGLDPAALVLEVTETRLLPDTPQVQDALQALRELGVHLAVDDFGTGFASTEYLAAFPFDAVKIDGRYTRALLGDDVRMQRLARGVFALAAATGLTTVAECVETTAQADAVLALGCGIGQGWLYAKALPPEQLARTLLRPAGAAAVPGPRAAADARTPAVARTPAGALTEPGGTATRR